MQHISVLTDEAVSALNLSTDSVVVDCTLGAGGHARTILDQLGPTGHFIGIDIDPTAHEQNQSLTEDYQATVSLLKANFRSLSSLLEDLHLESVDAILADLGWRMEQFSSNGKLPRGFSFQADEPLFMTFGQPEEYAFSAADILNEWDEADIANVIYGYGEERFARRIAKEVVARRQTEPFATTGQLVVAIEASVPATYRRGKTHPATKTFQALRIAVNDEFSALEEFLPAAIAALRPGGRLAVISFHSLEDRIVKQTFKNFVTEGTITLVNKKPVVASETELFDNPRARSAKLRTIEKN